MNGDRKQEEASIYFRSRGTLNQPFDCGWRRVQSPGVSLTANGIRGRHRRIHAGAPFKALSQFCYCWTFGNPANFSD
jgi:hypothetical protein